MSIVYGEDNIAFKCPHCNGHIILKKQYYENGSSTNVYHLEEGKPILENKHLIEDEIKTGELPQY